MFFRMDQERRERGSGPGLEPLEKGVLRFSWPSRHIECLREAGIHSYLVMETA